MPTLKVEAGFGSTMFTGSPTWTDLTGRVRQPVMSNRGRPSVDGRFDAGTASIVFDNRDAALTPENTQSPYYPNVVIGVPIRVSVVDGMTTYPVFYGSVSSWPPDYPRSRGYTVTVPLVDGFETLNLTDLSGRTYPAQSTTARLNAVLNHVGWPAGLRDFDTGLATVQATSFAAPNDGGEQPALLHLLDVAEAEAGVLYMSADGKVTFRNRISNSGVSPLAEFTDADENIHGLSTAFNNDFLWNVIQVARENGVQVEVDSAGSGPRRTLTRDVMPMGNDAEALNVAEWLADVFGAQRLRVDQLTVKTLKPGLAAVFGLELRDMVTVTHQPEEGDPVDQDCVVEVINNQFLRGDWITTFSVTPLAQVESQDYWILGTSELGVSTRLA